MAASEPSAPPPDFSSLVAPETWLAVRETAHDWLNEELSSFSVALQAGALVLAVLAAWLLGRFIGIGLRRLALQPFLRAAEIARNDREFHGVREFRDVFLGAENKRAQNEQVALVIDQLGRHGGEAPAVKQVHHEGFQRIVAVMAQHDAVAAFLPRDAIENPPAQPRT